MTGWTAGDWLFYGGIVMMSLATISAIVATIVFRRSGRRLQRQFDEEFGEKQHG